VSLSMSAEDFAPNRLGAAARAAQALVARRPHDRFGVMTFAGDVQMNCPLTTDHAAVIECLGTAVIEGRAGGTALGEAIAQAANGLRRSGDGGRAVLLLTDGGQNAGPIDAVQAASAAATLGIRVYTGGIGSNEPAPVPTEMGRQMVPLDLDESTLRQVASVARGRYFRVADETSLMRMSEEFDRMQPAPYMVRHTSGQASVAHAFALAMIAALALEVALACTVCRAVP
jgi:Ca-activated chloride channel family protein